jgi:hypothetical protein
MPPDSRTTLMPQGTASLRLRPGCDIQQEGACKAPLPFLLSVGIEHKLLAVGQHALRALLG